jgi:hypothetical protein
MRAGHKFVILATRARRDLVMRFYRVQRPNTIHQPLWDAYQLGTAGAYKKVQLPSDPLH